MKIKSVCEQTGLTDRAIRYYIEEKLISPSFPHKKSSHPHLQVGVFYTS